ADIAVHHARPFFIAETTCPEQVALERILGRDRSTSTSNALTEEAYRSNRQSFEPVDVTALKRELPRLSITRFTVDTSLPPFSWYVVGEEIRD
ncbi:MAG: hypothetical protein N2506_06500, partial [Dehalococcoidales bacterium]|nr:hypothetical protein [Dehalococcoidales bacterium]